MKISLFAFLALLVSSAFSELGPDTIHDNIPGTATVRQIVQAGGGGGGGGGINTNAVIDIIHATVDGAARPLPKYLHLYNADDSYPYAAAEYYRSRGNGKADGGCSSVRDGGFLYRNFDYPFDDRSEFVVRMSAGKDRFASVGVAQVGTNLTEQMVTSGKPEYSRLYKWLPGATVDGINEHGVVAEINVVNGPVTNGWHTTGDLHPLAAVRWALDHATNAQHAAEHLAANIRFPEGWQQNFHYMIADESDTYIVENGHIVPVAGEKPMTNFQVIYFSLDHWSYDPNSGFYFYGGEGKERLDLLYYSGANITNVWYTNAYRRETNPPWVSDLRDVLAYTNEIFDAWASHPKEYFRNRTNGGEPWWQTVHTSVYDITNRVIKVAVQETDDWYTFQVDAASSPRIDAYTKAETDELLDEKLDGPTDPTLTISGKAADALKTKERTTLIPQFSEWTFSGTAYEPDSHTYEIDMSQAGPDPFGRWHYNLLIDGSVEEASEGPFDKTDLEYAAPWQGEKTLMATRVITGYKLGTQTPVLGTPYTPSADDSAFSNAVLSVGIDTNVLAAVAASTNAVAQIGEFYSAFSDIGLTPTQGGMTLAGLLAALVAAVTWLKRTLGKVADNSGKPTDDFAGELMEKQVAKDAVNDLIEDRIEDSTTSTSTTDALSANMGKELQDQIQNLKQRGRYLSIWNCTTGLAETEPTVNPYPYKAGDYFIVGTVGATNYRPNGAQYDKNTASTTPETATVLTNDTYYYDGTSWSLLHTPMPPVPTEYLKSATAADNSLTVTKQDNTQVSLTVKYEYAVGAFGSSIASGEIRTIAPITLTVPVTLNLGNSATESADCALWVDTSNLASDVTLSLSSNYNYFGDTGYQTMTKGKHILVTFLRLNATDVIVTKKEY